MSNNSPFGSNQIAIRCNCHTPDHTILFLHDCWENDPPELYMYVQLTQHQSFWRRVVCAVRYIFGRTKSGHGHWDETIISHDNVVKLRAMCDVVIDHSVDYNIRNTNFSADSVASKPENVN